MKILTNLIWILFEIFIIIPVTLIAYMFDIIGGVSFWIADTIFNLIDPEDD